MPTGEEWIYAAHGGENYLYSGSDNCEEVGWYAENDAIDKGGITHEVGKKKPNKYGLYDMSGNIAEWVWDPFEYPDSYNLRYYYGDTFAAMHFDYDDIDYIETRKNLCYATEQVRLIGFRIARTVIK